ncbi:hypothetical protein BH10PAT4_BH10PAT4_4100 [soil metagenome]
MHKKTKTSIQTNIVNIFGALGYLACTVQWLWGLILYSTLLQSYLTSITPVVITPVAQPVASTVDGNFSIIFLIFGIIVTVLVIALTIYLVIKTPSTIVKSAVKIVHETAETITPAVLHIERKQDTVINHKNTATNIRLILKTAIVAIPFVASILSQLTLEPLFSSTVIVYSSVALLSLTVLLFVIQSMLGTILKVNGKDIW